jgi:hypothetical protein
MRTFNSAFLSKIILALLVCSAKVSNYILKINQKYDVLVHAEKKCNDATLIFKRCLYVKIQNMKKFLVVFLACISSAIFAQQTETRNLGSFTGVKVSEGISVYLKKGEKESAKIEVTGTSPSNVITEISGSYLKVHMRDGNHRNVNAKVYVTYVSVQKLYASSAGSIYSSETLKGNDMEINASSAGTIEVLVDAGRLEASASSAGDIEIQGKARNVLMDASSAGEVDAYDLQAMDAEVEASSGGAVKLSVSNGIDARASSGGSIRYRGNPDKSNTTSSSGGSVKKSN